jgi:2-dehydro-3-deoxygluconokinase
MSLDVVTFGEAMAMFIASEVGELHKVKNFTRALAGAETNVAIGLSRLGYKVGWISKVGDDPFGKYITESLQQEKIDINCIKVDSNFHTGFQLKSKVLTGDPEVKYFRKGSAASTLCVNDIDDDYVTGARHLHATGIPAALSQSAREFEEEVIRKMKASNRTISFDPNLRLNLWNSESKMVETINRFAVQADWVFPGISEGKILTGYSNPKDIAAFYLDKGVKLVVIKLGPQGAYFRTIGKEGGVSGFTIKNVVDTVGAGDGFAVGVISGLLDGLKIDGAVKRGNAIGALAVMSPGDSDGLPTREGLKNFIINNKRGV